MKKIMSLIIMILVANLSVAYISDSAFTGLVSVERESDDSCRLFEDDCELEEIEYTYGAYHGTYFLEEYVSENFTFSNVHYEVEVIAIMEDTVILRINGEVTDKLSEKEIYETAGDLLVEIKTIIKAEGTESGGSDIVELSFKTKNRFIVDTREEYTTTTYPINGVDYEVEIISIANDIDDYVIFKVNGEVTEKLEEEDTYRLVSGLEITAKTIIVDPNSGIDIVEYSMGYPQPFNSMYITVETHTKKYTNAVIIEEFEDLYLRDDVDEEEYKGNKFLIFEDADGDTVDLVLAWYSGYDYIVVEVDELNEDMLDKFDIPELISPYFETYGSYLSFDSEDEYIYRDVELTEGWNLISIGQGMEFQNDEDFDDYIDAAYVFNSDDNKYYDLYEDDSILENYLAERGYAAVWVYINEPITLHYVFDLDEIDYTVQNLDFKIDDGWNFYVILPHFNKNYEDGYFNIFENNGVSAIVNDNIYAWAGSSWDSGNYESVCSENLVEEELIGIPFIAKYEDEIVPEYTPNLREQIPEFPEV